MAKQEGKEISKKHLDSFKKGLKKRENKHNKTVFGITFRSKKNQENKEDEEECIELPVRMAFGITVTLCGLFICFLPHPSAISAGVWVMGFGITQIIESGLKREEEYQEEKKRRNKKNGALVFTTY